MKMIQIRNRLEQLEHVTLAKKTALADKNNSIEAARSGWE